MATEIPLTRGQVVLVDDRDAAELSAWKWCACFQPNRAKFVAVRGERVGGSHRLVYMHRQLMDLQPGDGLEVDHINHDTLDNRRANLRVVTPHANKRWQPARGGSSQYVGVTWDTARKRWRAQIQIDGRVINLGRYTSEVDAAGARDVYVLEHDTGHELNLVG